MQQHPRYEILERIGRGQFATVYRARDSELGREVAVKQIHPQYLDDPRQLQRYWQEAQLLATLEHPRILTLYDLVRQQGWLVMERVPGSLRQLLDGRAIDLKDLRLTLIYTLQALQLLEQHGIVHGDVKPSNLLVDKNRRIKLGDFGIARRIEGNPDSVVRGTTRYMAPEVLSEQFGPVGPHSDLYSLGFSAFELLCGPDFESLFPGLHLFGRDRQAAWMMWHCDPSRWLPDLQAVLQGVPRELAQVIDKLTEKDPQRRYRTAAEVLDDLRNNQPRGRPYGSSEQCPPVEPPRSQQPPGRRWLATAALLVAAAISLGLALLPSGKAQSPPAPGPDIPDQGAVWHVDPQQHQIVLLPLGQDKPVRLDIDPRQDRIYWKDRRIPLHHVHHGDRLHIERLQKANGQPLLDITVTRTLPPQDSRPAEKDHD